MLIEVPDHLWEDIEKLIKDKGASNAPDSADIDKLIVPKDNVEQYGEEQCWGEIVTVPRNWQSSPEHPETFLAYITVAEAKLLRSLGLGYSEIDGEYTQHYDNSKIPSFNGYGAGDSDAGGFGGSDNSEGESEGRSAASSGTNSTGGWGSDGVSGGTSFGRADDYGSPSNATDYNQNGIPDGVDLSNAYDLSGVKGWAYANRVLDSLSSRSFQTDGWATGTYIDAATGAYMGYSYDPSMYGSDYSVYNMSSGLGWGGANVNGQQMTYNNLGWGANATIGANYYTSITGTWRDTASWNDVHMTVDGEFLGTVDEAIADIAEMMGFEVDAATASAIQSTTTAIGGAIAGVSTITQVAMSVAAVADIGYAAGTLDKDTRDAMKAAAAVIGFADTAIAGMQTISTIGSLQNAGYINSAQAAMGYAATALSLGIGFSQLSSALAGMGVNTAGITDVSAMAFGWSALGIAASAKFALTGNINDIFSAYASWDFSVNVANSLSVNTVTKDPFGFMAGGELYDAQSAGSELHTVIKSRDPKISVDRKLDIGKTATQLIAQEDSIYKELSPIDTSVVENVGTGDIAAAKAARFNRLIDDYNRYVEAYEADVDAYNTEVATFNAGLDSITSQEDYDSAKESLDSTLTGISDRLSDTSGLISNVIDEINDFV